MKYKRAVNMLLISVMAFGLLSGCGVDNTPGSIPDNTPPGTPEKPTAAARLSAEEDARLKAELQQDIDAILNTETEIVHSDTYIPGDTYTGTAYYVSNDGNDDNDGLTPETAWQTLEKVVEVNGFWGDAPLLKAGDAVFFRRGDIFRLKEIGWDPYLGDQMALHLLVDGVTYSAYGEGEKPIITESTENGSGSEKWNLVYEDDAGKKIWQYYRDMRDVARLVLNDGEVLTPRVYEYYDENGYISCEATGWWQHEAEGVTLLDTLLPLEESMTEDLTIISRPVRLEPESHWINADVGPLYLRCDKGNPGELYQSIEFTEYQLGGIVQVRASNLVFDNISFRCNGSAYMKCDNWKEVQNTVIQNCEFAYGGCTVTFYREREDGALVVEVQGDGIYNIVRNTTVQNNYFHDGPTSSATYEGDNFDDKDAVNGYFHYLDNVSVNTNGIRLDSTADALKHLDSVKVCGNQVWNTGRMDNGKYGYSEGALVLLGFNNYGECIIEDNVFYGTEKGGEGFGVNGLLNLPSYDYEDPVHAQYTKPQMQNNIYAQYSDRDFALYLYHSAETWAMDDPELLTKAADLLGDTTSKFYIIP